MKKSVRSIAGASLRRKNNKNAMSVRAQRQQWKLETLEPKILLSADGAPGVHRIEGSIDQPGEQDVYEFVVAEKTRFFFDGISGDQMSWQLQGSNSADSFGSRTLGSISERFLDLNPFTHLAISYQEILYFEGDFGHWKWLLALGFGSALLFLFAYFLFDRLRDSFAEEV